MCALNALLAQLVGHHLWKMLMKKHPLGAEHENMCASKNEFVKNVFVNNSCDICKAYHKATKDYYYKESKRCRIERNAMRERIFDGANRIETVFAPHDKYLAFIRLWISLDNNTCADEYPAEQIANLEHECIQWKLNA